MTARRRGSVFLLTDYGGADEFAGVVRAVVARHVPEAPVVDLSHEVPAFDVRAGALALERAAPYLGPGVVMAVVDPGVGTARRAVAAESGTADGPRHFVGPDNGLLVWAMDALGGAQAAVELGGLGAGAARTFDGRDLFAPVAARLWRGAALSAIGTPIDVDTLTRLPRPRLVVAPGRVETEVQWIDRFGNAQLSARPADVQAAGLSDALEVVIGTAVHRARAVSTFGQLAEDIVGLVADANGQLALVLDRRPVATSLGVQVGDVVVLGPIVSSATGEP